MYVPSTWDMRKHEHGVHLTAEPDDCPLCSVLLNILIISPLTMKPSRNRNQCISWLEFGAFVVFATIGCFIVQWPKCTKEPHYASRGERARTCFTHKQDGWVPVNRRRCHMEGCMRGASFSLMGSSAIFCGSHRYAYSLLGDAPNQSPSAP